MFHKVWQLSDYRKVGSLDKEGFFIALSLISLAQQGKRLGLDVVREKGIYTSTFSLLLHARTFLHRIFPFLYNRFYVM